MIRIAGTLRTDHIRLSLNAKIGTLAIDEIALLLRNDPGIEDWDEFHAGLHRSSPCLSESAGEFAICLPHARTDAVNQMVMGIGRSLEGVRFEGCEKPVRYVFCIGVPKALTSDYLRIVGLLARIVKDSDVEHQLREATTPAEVIQRLSAMEARL